MEPRDDEEVEEVVRVEGGLGAEGEGIGESSLSKEVILIFVVCSR